MRQVNGGSVRLVQLRNPWGKLGWRGDWSEGSALWSAPLRRRLQPHGAGEGTFWMCWRDFCRFFSAVDVCRLRPHPHPHPHPTPNPNPNPNPSPNPKPNPNPRPDQVCPLCRAPWTLASLVRCTERDALVVAAMP